jgi:F-type H+-transporting ATPase subunit delta
VKYTRTQVAKAYVAHADTVGYKKATKQLAYLILDQHMHSDVDEILADIAVENARVHGIIEAEAKTAHPLSSSLKKDLEERVKKETKAKKVILHEEIDRSLLGGVIVTAPNMELDLSLKTKLAKLKV